MLILFYRGRKKMKPNQQYITIFDNREKIVAFVNEMLVDPRRSAHKWSEMTNQTPNLKIGYPGQHLASLILGMKGTATGARGNDIIDGTEVKSCSLVDQSDKCKECGTNVFKTQTCCPVCNSTNIRRNFDSKWLIPVRNEYELRMATIETPRFLFLITDYPDRTNFDNIRIRAFEVYPQESRGRRFNELLNNYYNYIYIPHIKKNPNQTPAPKNLFPDSFPFYMCNPVKIFECSITNSIMNPEIQIHHYVEPEVDRDQLESEQMPINLLSETEKRILMDNGINTRTLEYITESMREYLPLRETDKKIKTIGTKKHK